MNDPASELSLLARALRRHVRRRQVLGDRRADRWVVPRTETPERVPEKAPVQAPVQAPEKATVKAVEPSPPVAVSDWPSDWGSTPDHKDESERRTRLLAERAASCPNLQALQAALSSCTACSLSQTHSQVVFMDGAGPARVMFVGEAPGYHEDQQGIPFVGRAGQLLTDIIEKGMGLSRSEVVIANVLKCRPPENRDPLPVEKRLCTTWLDRQIDLVDPEILIALGRHAAGHLIDSDSPLSRLRGRLWQRAGRKVLVTYHPAYLLRTPSDKKECWKDIQMAMTELGLGRSPS